MANFAQGAPTKEFFISMLTRDIDLNDAILDLLDNCLDGVVRTKTDSKSVSNTKDFYNGFYARITISKNKFIIEDNCGGIPREVAEKRAFRMGRSPEFNENSPTVGIYGIGMKRAIFKIGHEAIVLSNHKDSSFSVRIPKNWGADNDNWDFPMADESADILANKGTKITIQNLTEGVAALWKTGDSIDDFVDQLIKAIKTSYSLIIEKGFNIFVNDTQVPSSPVQFLFSGENTGIAPYIYVNNIDGVEVNLAVGLYTPLLSDSEQDEIAENKRTSGDAGWTVVCNDRVVLYNDKTHLTGWGEAGVPSYHTQFIGIRGIVSFRSSDPSKLPMTTTKRGVDLSSTLYAEVKNKMREGLKLFTTYTNSWKGRNSEEREYSKCAKRMDYADILNEDKVQNKLQPAKNKTGGRTYQPVLPKPHRETNYDTIRFMKPREDVVKIKAFLFDDASLDISPSEIGEKCFDRTLKEAEQNK